MSELEQQLRRLVLEACRHPPGSLQRQKYLTQIIRLVSPKLWRESSPYYGDALQQTWLYFCRNLCERGTGEAYNPDRSSLPTWLNAYLKRRLQDFFIDTQQERAILATPKPLGSKHPETLVDPIEHVAAAPDIPPILDRVKQWAESDPMGELQKLHIEGHPHVTCQVLILRRLPPETSWKDLAQEFGLAVSTLSSFYQRQCLPRLRKFGETEGYL